MQIGKSISPVFFNKITSTGYVVALSCCFIFINSKSFAQATPSLSLPCTIKGSVIDSISKEPLAAVSIALFSEINSTLILKNITTKENGNFEITSLPNQAYKVVITATGYTVKTIHIPASDKAVYVNNISLAPQYHTLQEVEVTTNKTLVTYDADKLIYNVEDDPESEYATTFDILHKVPMLFVDEEGNIQLNGSSNYQVLLNNRPSSLFVNDPSEVFKSLPANSVKSIEIITNPPAKYDAEGVSGIINVITYKKNVTGIMSNLRGGYNSPGGSTAGGSLTFKTGKISFSGLGNFNQNNNPASTSSYNRWDKVNNTSMQQEGSGLSTYKSWNAGGEMSWEMSNLDMLTTHYNTNHNMGSGTYMQQSALFSDVGESLQAYNNESRSNNASVGYDWGIDYQHRFKNNDAQLLSISYRALTSNNTSGYGSFITAKLYTPVPSGRSNNESGNTERTVQIDYAQPIKKHLLEIGVKAISRTNNSDYVFERLDTTTGLYVIDKSFSNNYNNTQTIYAGYASLSLKLGTWMLRTGARAEETNVSAQFHGTNTTASQSYANILPNITLSKKIGKTANLSASYSQRIQRPGLYYLNPYVDNRDPYNIYYGNPDLKTTVTHVTTLLFSTYHKGVSFNVNLYHNYTGNSILRYTTIGIDTVARTTYGNIGNEQTDGLSIGTGFTLFKKLSLSFNTGSNYYKYTSSINNSLQKNEGFSYQLSGYAGFSFLKTWRTGVNASYSSSSISFQSRSAGYFTHSLSLNKGFFKNRKAALTINISNPFRPYRHSYTEIEQEQFHITQQYQILVRRFNFTFNYRFGKLNGGTRPKKTIQNDDLKEK